MPFGQGAAAFPLGRNEEATEPIEERQLAVSNRWLPPDFPTFFRKKRGKAVAKRQETLRKKGARREKWKRNGTDWRQPNEALSLSLTTEFFGDPRSESSDNSAPLTLMILVPDPPVRNPDFQRTVKVKEKQTLNRTRKGTETNAQCNYTRR